MDITTVENLVNTRGQIKISERNGWAAGTVGIALGYNAQYDTVRVGFVDAEGVYTGEKTTVSRSMVEEVPEAPLPVVVLETLITERGRVRISERNDWAAGTVGIPLSYYQRDDTVRVGFLDDRGNYTGSETTVARSMLTMAVPAVGDRVTVLYPGGTYHPTVTRESVVRYVSPLGRVHVHCAEPCGACGPGDYQGNHRVGMAGSRIVSAPSPAPDRRCACDLPAACAVSFPAKCPF